MVVVPVLRAPIKLHALQPVKPVIGKILREPLPQIGAILQPPKHIEPVRIILRCARGLDRLRPARDRMECARQSYGVKFQEMSADPN